MTRSLRGGASRRYQYGRISPTNYADTGFVLERRPPHLWVLNGDATQIAGDMDLAQASFQSPAEIPIASAELRIAVGLGGLTLAILLP